MSGREIVATEDHKFMCADGWMEVGNMSKDTKIGILCEPIEMSSEVKEVEYILTEEKFKEELKSHEGTSSLIITHCDILKSAGFIPLFNDDKQLPILARLFGHLMSDGWIGVTHRSKYFVPSFSGNLPTELDAETLEGDILKLGFKNTIVRELRTGGTHHIWRISHEGALPSLLISLGIMCGKKTEQERKLIPYWITSGSECCET